jgi:hypothetical protein
VISQGECAMMKVRSGHVSRNRYIKMDYTTFLAHFESIATDIRDKWEFFYPIEYATFTICEDGKIFTGSKYIAKMPKDFDFEALWRDTKATMRSNART